MSVISSGRPQDEPARVVRRQRDRGTPILLGLSLVLLACAALTVAYPWADLIHRSGTPAMPSSLFQPPPTSVTAWCVDLAPYSDEPQLSRPMGDDGVSADRLPGDGVYSLQVRFPTRGTHFWRVTACDDAGVAFPEAPAWVWVTEAGQEIVLTFDTNQRSHDRSDRLLPRSFIVNALDRPPPLYLYGTVNDWAVADEATRFQELSVGRYRLIYQVPREGSHQVTISFVDGNGRQHGFMGDGRSESWNMFEFETREPFETIIAELDANTGRSAIFYDIPLLPLWMAHGTGFAVISALMGGLALALAFLALQRYRILRRAGLYVEAGCPNCGEPSLMRIPRTGRMRLSPLAGLNIGRYSCRECVWLGMRLVGGEVELPRSRSVSRWLPIVVTVILLLLAFAMAFGLRAYAWNSAPPAGNGAAASAEVHTVEFGSVGELLEPVWDNFLQSAGLLGERLDGLLEDMMRQLAAPLTSTAEIEAQRSMC